MLSLSHLEQTSKAWWQTGVNHISFTLDLKKQDAQLNKKMEKLVSVLTESTALSKAKMDQKKDHLKDLNKKLATLRQQLTELKVLKIKIKLYVPY